MSAPWCKLEGVQVTAFRLLAATASRTPRRWVYRIARLTGVLLSVLPSARRDAVRDNMAVVHGLHRDHPTVRSDARRAQIHAQLNYADILRAGSPRFAQEVRRLSVPDWTLLDTTLARGKGLILVSAHLGNFEMVVQALAVRGLSTLVVVEPMRPPALLEFFRHQRAAIGLDIEPVGSDTFRHMMARLRDNGIVAIMSDRDIQASGHLVSLFGHPVSLPSAAVLLSIRTGAPIISAFAYRYADGGTSGRVGSLLTAITQDTGLPKRSLKDRMASGMQELALVLEREITRDPGQWVVQQPVFATPAPARHAGDVA